MANLHSQFIVASEGWFDGEQHHNSATTFLVENGRVVDISEGDLSAIAIAKDMEIVKGGYLIPGLIDAHVHLFLDGAPTDSPTRSAHMKKSVEELTEAARESARQALACGVTWVRDAGDKHGINHAVRDEAVVNKTMSQVRSGGIAIRRPKRYGAFMAREAADDQAIRDAVAESAKSSDEIKLILTGIIDFEAGAVTDEPQFDLDAAKIVVHEAHNAGLKTFAHCSGIKGLRIAAEAGVDSIEHGFFMDREILSIMRDKNIAWTPTFCPVHFQWAVPEAIGWSPETVDNLRRILDNHAEHLRLAHEMGVPLLIGTDAGSMGVEHGKAIYQELKCFLDAGLPMAATLRAATSTTRKHFGLADPLLKQGSGFEAVLLSQSPFVNPESLKEPINIWRG